jgi:hypothetical protein
MIKTAGDLGIPGEQIWGQDLASDYRPEANRPMPVFIARTTRRTCG